MEKSRQAADVFEKIREKTEEEDTPATKKEDYQETGVEPSKIEALSRENPDIFGWIQIPDTRIDYPVMHTPDDPEFYLHRDFYKRHSQWGTPFLSGACFDGCGHYLIYAHHMRDGSMFAQLLDYKDRDFAQAHPRIYLSTKAGQETYSVWAAAYVDLDDPSFNYYTFTNLRDRTKKYELIDMMRTHAVYVRDVDPVEGELMTLSTCSYHTDNGRFIVMAVKN